MKIALFGTSADPPTLAHQEILIWLSQHFDLVTVWASDNPFKSQQTPLLHRQKMLELLITNISNYHENIKHCPQLTNSRTIFTVEQAKEIWHDADFTLVIGADLLSNSSQALTNHSQGLQILHWYRVKDLLSQVNLLIFPRPNYSVSQESLTALEKLCLKVAIADFESANISSTAYREKGDNRNITDPIQTYINQENLYKSVTGP